MADNIGVGIGIAAGASAVTALIMSVIYKQQVKPLFKEGDRPVGFLEFFSIINWFKILYYFLPYALFLFGVIYDGLVRKIKFFPAGFVGLAAVYLNSSISWLTGGSYEDKDICGIPGMSKWGSDITPQNIVFTTSVLSYIASYITSGDPTNSAYAGSAWAGVFAVWLLQTGIFNAQECYSGKLWFLTFGNSIATRIVPPLIGLASGMLWGGLAGWGFSNLKGDDAGVGLSSEAKQSLTQTSGPAMASTSGTAGAGKCSPTSDDDQFVCEAYKNGELVTSTIVE